MVKKKRISHGELKDLLKVMSGFRSIKFYAQEYSFSTQDLIYLYEGMAKKLGEPGLDIEVEFPCGPVTVKLNGGIIATHD